jgi:hypothetical protein
VHLFSFIKKKPTNNKKNGIKGGGKERKVSGFKFLGFLGDGFGVKEEKKEARADCVRSSRAPTRLLY